MQGEKRDSRTASESLNNTVAKTLIDLHRGGRQVATQAGASFQQHPHHEGREARQRPAPWPARAAGAYSTLSGVADRPATDRDESTILILYIGHGCARRAQIAVRALTSDGHPTCRRLSVTHKWGQLPPCRERRKARPTSSCTLAGRRGRRLRRFCVGAPSWRIRLGEACTTSFILASQRSRRARSESVSASQMGSAGFSWVRLSGGWAAGTQQATSQA